MSDESTPFPDDELAALVAAAERFGSAATQWLDWACNVEVGTEDGDEHAWTILPQLRWSLLNFDRAVSAPVEGRSMPTFIERAGSAAEDVEPDALVTATLALRIAVRHYELQGEIQDG